MFREHGAQAFTRFANSLDEDDVARGDTHAALDERLFGSGDFLDFFRHVKPCPHDTPKRREWWKNAARVRPVDARVET